MFGRACNLRIVEINEIGTKNWKSIEVRNIKAGNVFRVKDMGQEVWYQANRDARLIDGEWGVVSTIIGPEEYENQSESYFPRPRIQ